MAEFVYWKIGADTQILMNEQVYLDFRGRVETLHNIMGEYLSHVKDREPDARLSVNGFMGLNYYNAHKMLTPIFMNTTNIDFVLSSGLKRPKFTGILTNFSDEIYYTRENAEQISLAGMCVDFDALEADGDINVYQKPPHIYECPISDIDVDMDGSGQLSRIYAEHIAVIERPCDQDADGQFNDQDKLIILPQSITSREQMDGQALKHGRAKFSTQKRPHGEASYIYPFIGG
tara:strand:- start:214644 stop:215339 length:696 start_codon:yes stop_codon:yes gene_type:complete